MIHSQLRVNGQPLSIIFVRNCQWVVVLSINCIAVEVVEGYYADKNNCDIVLPIHTLKRLVDFLEILFVKK